MTLAGKSEASHQTRQHWHAFKPFNDNNNNKVRDLLQICNSATQSQLLPNHPTESEQTLDFLNWSKPAFVTVAHPGHFIVMHLLDAEGARGIVDSRKRKILHWAERGTKTTDT